MVAKTAMKKFLFVAFIFPLSLMAAKPTLTAKAVVDYIIDGDTFGATVILDDRIEIPVRVRFMNIDAPELSGECESETKAAVKAKDRLAELIPVGTHVTLSEIKDDKYLGRINAFVADGNGRDVGEIMVREKHSVRYGGGKRSGWCD
ncbi:MAG: thermonuclease family protein [Alphaproteobacteria bacterium]|nr:thermonuclease family protein [Alphaproteobacteria bacterium]